MKKRMMRAATVVLTLLMTFSVFSTMVLAAEGDSKSVAPEKGTLHIHKFIMEDISGLTGSNNGNEVEAADLPEGAEPLGGITFDVYGIKIPASGVTPQNGPYILKEIESKLYLQDNGGEGSYNQFELIAAKQVTTNNDKENANYGIGSIELDQGFYFVVERESNAVAYPVAPFVVAVPMTNPTGDGWLTDVHVYPKNEDMSILKKVDHDAVTIGDIVTYTLIPSIPTNIGTANKYVVTDKIDDALIYQGNGTVSVVGATNQALSGAATIDADNYTVSYSASTKTLTVELTAKGFQTLKTEGYKFLGISFQAKSTKAMLEEDDYTVGNTATFTFKNNAASTTTQTRTSNQVDIHTAAIEVLKVDSKDITKTLKGATFQIASSYDNARKGIYLKRDDDGNILDAGDDDYADANVWEETSGTNGRILFEGLQDFDKNDNARKYWVVETQAPEDGYNLLGKPVEVSMEDSELATDDNDVDVSYTVYMTVKNSKGFTLPITGGMGTVLFTVGGVLLIGVALVLILSQNKKKAKAK